MQAARDPRYDVLFESVAIGPLAARNRFFQVPHCNGMGYRDPSALAAMRGIKAEGGWAVVATEETEIHHSSEISPSIEGRIWDDRDIPAHTLVTDAIHQHGALAAIQLVHNGMWAANTYTRIPPMGPSHRAVSGDVYPIQARRMDKSDVADLRRWHRQAVARSLEAGYDIVYVYAGHGGTTLQHFLSPQYNDRSDEYGGSLDNRARLLREVLEDTLEEVAGRAAVACRLTVDELIGERGLRRDDMDQLMGLIGELPDLWDFTAGYWEDDSVTSRFGPENDREDLLRGLKDLTTKPVVGVGRFTSPDTMVRMVSQGVLDFIGAARPSIADPFLPEKIEQGRADEIRECIGCNICVAGDWTMSPIRCTQNPAMGEEWRRGWHPEVIRPKARDGRVLIVGGGPAGMEAAMSAGRRGYEVVLIEATRELGGRVAREALLPGLVTWIRVRDYRLDQINRLGNVAYYFESAMTADEILSYDFDHVAVATGATWRRDGVGRSLSLPVDHPPDLEVLTPDDLLDGSRPSGSRVAVYDDDHYYMGGVLAELLVKEGLAVTLVTPAADVSNWAHNTMEQRRIQGRLLDLGVGIITAHELDHTDPAGLALRSVYNGRPREVECETAVLVTSRLPDDAIYLELVARQAKSVRAIGDAFSPGTIASAIWDGRRFAEELDAPRRDEPFPRNIAAV